ncbi:hypothetical protein V2P41_00155 [Mesomycoplasma hyopneumoniae]|uniref:hypothetical protein n=1 Tax=Mesomycoplasma hyopneumoniae TaxID=2099 RepID=UPI003DA5CC83
MYKAEIKRLLISLKNLTITLISIRGVRFVIEIIWGIMAFWLLTTWLFTASSEDITDPKIWQEKQDAVKNQLFRLSGPQFILLLVLIGLIIANWIFYIMFFIKLNRLQKLHFYIQNPIIIARLSTIKSYTIIGFFVGYVDLVAAIFALKLVVSDWRRLTEPEQNKLEI